MHPRAISLAFGVTVRLAGLGVLMAGGTTVSAIPPDWRGPAPSNGAAGIDLTIRLKDYTSDDKKLDADIPPGPVTDTGADNCHEATVVPVPVGPPGSGESVIILGDNTSATGPECGAGARWGQAAGRHPGVRIAACTDDECDEPPAVSWWEAFEIDTCAKVEIRLCGTFPRNIPSSLEVTDSCAEDGSSCGPFFHAESWTRGICSDGNMWMRFDALPAGVYYYPIFSDETDPDFEGRGPYVLEIRAEECQGACTGCLGACCESVDNTCAEAVPPSQCRGDSQSWSRGLECCAALCNSPVGEFEASNVELLSWLPVEDFPLDPRMGNEMWGYVSPSGREYAIMGFTTATGFVEVTDPRNPVILNVIDGEVDTAWRDMDVWGSYAYVVTDGRGVGLQIVDMSDIDDGRVSLVNTTDLGVGLSTAHNVSINPDSGFMYLSLSNLNSRLGLTVVSLADPVNPIVRGFWTDSEANVRCHDVQVVTYDSGPYAGREIAFCFAENDGLKIVDVTDKDDMFSLSTLRYPTTSYTHQGWLDESRRFLYINDEADENNHPDVTETTTYVVDVTDLRNPTLVRTLTNGLCTIDHNLMVRGGRVYEANYTSGLRVYDVSDIDTAEEVASFDTYPETNQKGFQGAWGVFPLPSGTVLVSDRQRGLFVLCDNPDRPLARLAADANAAFCNQQIVFNGSGSTLCDRTRTIVRYEWDLDFDGVNFDIDVAGPADTVTTATTIFGALRVGLRVVDNFGASDVTSLEILVNQGSGAPTADAGGPYDIDVGEELVLDASGSTALEPECGNAIAVFSWDLDGDGAFDDAEGTSPIITLTAAEVASLGLPPAVPHSVTLRVTDALGQTSTATTTLTISNAGACCTDESTICDVMREVECLALAGDYRGDDTGCLGDANANSIPDGCECLAPSASETDACCLDVGHGISPRYLSFVPAEPGRRQAIRVTFRDLPGPFAIHNTQALWVGEPREVSENGGRVQPIRDFGTLTVASLQCEPFFEEWGAFGAVHVFHRFIVPGGIYEVQTVAEECGPIVEDGFSPPLSLTTSRFGDVVGVFDAGAEVWTPPDGNIDVAADAVAILEKFVSGPHAPGKAGTDVEPATPDQLINISDVTTAIDAFRGFSYPFVPGPWPCP